MPHTCCVLDAFYDFTHQPPHNGVPCKYEFVHLTSSLFPLLWVQPLLLHWLRYALRSIVSSKLVHPPLQFPQAIFWLLGSVEYHCVLHVQQFILRTRMLGVPSALWSSSVPLPLWELLHRNQVICPCAGPCHQTQEPTAPSTALTNAIWLWVIPLLLGPLPTLPWKRDGSCEF